MANSSMSKYEICISDDDFDFDIKKREQIFLEKNLIQAAIDGNHEKISELLKSVDVIEYNKLLFYSSENYMTPLQLAAARGHIKCVQILIEHGVDVNAKDRFDTTALHMAAEKGNYLCLKALLDAGADCRLPTKYSMSGHYKTAPHVGGTTPLHLAAANNHVDCVMQLIEYGADYNAIDEFGRTSLYIAAEHGFSKCVLAHLKIDVGRVILSLPGFQNNDTPLHLAVCHKMVDCIRELLYLGSDVNSLNNSGYSPLHQALSHPENTINTFEILKLLILEGYNTNINLRDSRNITPLHYVCFNEKYESARRSEMAQFLIAYGANVNIRNSRGIGLLEVEMKSVEEENGILPFIVRSMLKLPPLAELRLKSHKEPRVFTIDAGRNLFGLVPNDLDNDLRINRDLPARYPYMRANEALQDDLRRYREMRYLQMHDNEALQRTDDLRRYREMRYLQMHDNEANHLNINDLRQRPYNDVRLYTRRYSFEQANGANHFANDLRERPDDADQTEWKPCVLEKIAWYEKLASNPRTLQHCCRYIIRQTLSPLRLKHVHKLPIPPSLRSYILLERD